VLLPVDNLLLREPWSALAGAIAPGFTTPHNDLILDMIIQNYGWKRFLAEQIRQGQIPLWNPYLLGGAPFLASGQYQVLYPLGALFYLLPVAWAYGPYTALQLALAGVFTFGFLRRIGEGRTGAMVGAITFAICGSLITSVLWPQMIGAMVWLPAVLLCIELVLRATRLPTLPSATGDGGHVALSVVPAGAGSGPPGPPILGGGSDTELPVAASQSPKRRLFWASGGDAEPGAPPRIGGPGGPLPAPAALSVGVDWPRAALAVTLGAAAVAMQILAGHLEISFYVLFTAAAYACWRLAPLLWGKASRRAAIAQTGLLLAMGALGLGLAAVQLLPFMEAISRDYREGSATLADVRGWALPIRQLVTFVIPDFFGNPAQHDYVDLFTGQHVPIGPQADGTPTGPPATAFWGIKNYVEAAGYVGMLPLVLAPFGLLGRRNRFAGFFAMAAVAALLLAFGTPLYGLLFRVVPGFSQVHTAFRWVYAYSFAVACLAGMGANWLVGRASQLTRSAWSQLGGIAAVGTGLAGAAACVVTFVPRTRIAAQLQARIAADAVKPKDQWFLAAHLHDGREWFSLVWAHSAWAALMLLLAGTCVWLGLATRSRMSMRRLLSVALPGLVALDLFVVNGPFNSLVSPDLVKLLPAHANPPMAPPLIAPPGIATLQARAATEPPFRIASFGPQDVLAPNAGMLYGLQDVRGYDTIVLQRYARFLDLIEPQLQNLNLYSQTTKSFTSPKTLSSPLFDLLGVRYVLSTAGISDPHYRLVAGGPVKVYENSDALPRAFVVYRAAAAPDAAAALTRIADQAFRPGKEVVVEGPASLALANDAGHGGAAIKQYGANRVTIDVITDSSGYLVLADTYFPGWTARIRPASSGQGEWRTVDVVPADEAFRAIPLAAGHWTVEFRYQPLSFRTGLVISSLSLAVLLLMLAVAGWGALSRRLDLDANAARRVAKNAVSPMVSNLSNKLLDFGFNVFTAALIGPEGIGRFAEAVALAGLLGTVQDFGLGTITMRDVGRDRGLAAGYFKNTVLLRLTLAVAALPVLGIITLVGMALGAYDRLTVITLWLLVAGFFPGSIASAASGVLKATERFEWPAFVEVAANLMRILLGVVVLLLGWNVVGLAAVSLAVNLFNAVALSMAASAVQSWRTARLDGALCRYLWRESFTLMLNNLLNLVFFRIDVILLTFLLRDQAAIGYYSVAYKFIDGLGFVSAYLTTAIFPVFSRLAKEATEAFRALYVFALRLLVAVALPATAVVLVLADRVIALFYPAFGPSAPALRILILFLVFSYVNGLTQYALIAVGRQRRITQAFVIGVLFNIIANALLIPRFTIYAAAAVTVLSELVLLAPFLIGIWPSVRPLPIAQIVARPALAAAGTGAIALGLHQSSWLLLIPACLAAYPILFLLLGGLPATDRRQLAELFARRGAQVSEAT